MTASIPVRAGPVPTAMACRCSLKTSAARWQPCWWTRTCKSTRTSPDQAAAGASLTQGPAGRELQQEAGQPVGLEVRVVFDLVSPVSAPPRTESARSRSDSSRCRTGRLRRSGLVAHVRRVEVHVAEAALHYTQLADLSVAHQLPRAQPLRVAAHHERLLD